MDSHPTTAAAALANLDVLEKDNLIPRVRDEIGPYFQQKLAEFAGHPAVGEVRGWVSMEHDPAAPGEVRLAEGPHDDVFGHGTACAGIIRRVAPGAELYSVRVTWPSANGTEIVEVVIGTTLPSTT